MMKVADGMKTSSNNADNIGAASGDGNKSRSDIQNNHNLMLD